MVLFVIHTDDERELEFIRELSDELERLGENVEFFMMSRGTKEAPRFEKKVYVCAQNAREYKVEGENLVMSSQYGLSELIEKADAVISFL